MKFRQRSVLSIGLFSVLLTFYSIYVVFHQYQSLNAGDDVPVKLYQRVDAAQRLAAGILPEDGFDVAQQEADKSHDSLEQLRGHLQVMRRDLDESGYNDTRSRSIRIRSYMDRHPEVFQHHAVDILELAEQLKDDSDQSHDVALSKFKPAAKSLDNLDRSRPNSNDAFKYAEPLYKTFHSLKPEVDLPQTNPFTDAMASKIESLLNTVKAVRYKHLSDRPLIARLKPHEADNASELHWWQQWQDHITWQRLYTPTDTALRHTLEELVTAEIDDLYQHTGGTQLKLVFYLENDQRAFFKPMRFPRAQETLPDHMYYSDYERHYAEIAAFHLDKVLEFYRVPPTVGRLINVTQDVRRLADKALGKTFFRSPAGNICFHGQCDYYCDTGHAVCGRPEMLEGSMQAYLPSSKFAPRKTWRHPWRRSYHKRNKAVWETDMGYCSRVRDKHPYNQGRRLLDLMDLSVFDFLMGNMDRHHYETFESFGNFTFLLHLDNGRGFGKSWFDDMSILAPISQCCLIRYSTLRKLVRFYRGPTHLSDALRESLSADVAQPVLLDTHLHALDRRVQIILRTVYHCAVKKGTDAVIKRDDF